MARELVRQNEAATFINTGTAASYFANPGQSSYTMSKLAVNMLLEQLNAGMLSVCLTSPRISKLPVRLPPRLDDAEFSLEYSELRVFNVHPGMAKSSVLRKELEIYAKDTRRSLFPLSHFKEILTSGCDALAAELFGSTTVWLAGADADFLRGRFVAANWDVDELLEHQNEIVDQGLLKSQPFKGNIGNGGHFSS